MLKYLFDLFLFTSLFIAGCAWLMAYQTNDLLHLHYDQQAYLVFVFFSTLCSYNFHWYLSADAASENARVKWTEHHKMLHVILMAVGAAGAIWYFFTFISHWIWLAGAVALTFLYSAPKLSFGPFAWLKHIAIGKTIFLSFVWMYVTTLLPIAIDNNHWNMASLLFCGSRFFLIYAICIIFDYRDRDYDRKDGIRTLITYFNEAGINNLFAFTLAVFVLSTIGLYFYGFTPLILGLLLVPGVIVAIIYPMSKKNFSDYLYYFVLDGLMMLSSLLTLFVPNK